MNRLMCDMKQYHDSFLVNHADIISPSPSYRYLILNIFFNLIKKTTLKHTEKITIKTPNLKITDIFF